MIKIYDLLIFTDKNSLFFLSLVDERCNPVIMFLPFPKKKKQKRKMFTTMDTKFT